MITLDGKELEWCQKYAEKCVSHYGDSFGSRTYNHNYIGSNIVGIKGELAVAKWLCGFLESSAIKRHFETIPNTNAGDISFHQFVIEVKSLRPDYWVKFRRMVPPNQLVKYCKNNTIIVWTTATGDSQSNSVTLKGWNFAKDLQEKGIPVKTKCDNIWLKDDADMRDILTLFELLHDTQMIADMISLGY